MELNYLCHLTGFSFGGRDSSTQGREGDSSQPRGVVLLPPRLMLWSCCMPSPSLGGAGVSLGAAVSLLWMVKPSQVTSIL